MRQATRAMTMSPKIATHLESELSEAARVRSDYGFARARDLAFDAVLTLWRKRSAGGMTQSDLANRLGRDPGWVSRKISGPGNWTLRTLGAFVEALDGELEIVATPLEQPLVPRPNFDAYDVGDQGTRALITSFATRAIPVTPNSRSSSANAVQSGIGQLPDGWTEGRNFLAGVS